MKASSRVHTAVARSILRWRVLKKIQEDQFPLSGVSDEAAISEQSTVATDNPVEPEDEEDEVNI